MKKTLITLFAVAMLLTSSSLSNADTIFSIDDITTTAGSSVSVGVFVESTNVSFLEGVDIAIDFGDTDDTSEPSGLTFTGFTEVDPLGGGVFTTFNTTGVPTGANYNGQLSDASISGAQEITTTPRQLISLQFDVAADASGTFVLDLLGDGEAAPNDIFGVTGTDLGEVSVQNGSITITAVPEPSSVLALFGLAMVGVTRRRRR